MKGLILLVSMMALATGARANTAAGPVEVVEDSAQRILEVLEERHDELEQNREELFRVVDELLLPNFDVVYAGRVVLGKHGREATPEQRRRFIDGFYQSLLRTYAEGLLDFDADSMRVLPYRGEEGATKARVRTVVTLANGTETPVVYSLRIADERWKVYDVTIEGISYLTNYRKEVGSQVREKGLDGLIADLEARKPLAEGQGGE